MKSCIIPRIKNTTTGIKRIFKAFTYSGKGFVSALQSEAAFRQDLLVFIVGVVASFFFDLTSEQRALMISSLFLILLMELVNTAIESVVDRISDDYHPLSGKAKDIGSLLVLLAFLNAICVWGLILF